MLALALVAPARAVVPNLIVNGNFSSGFSGWVPVNNVHTGTRTSPVGTTGAYFSDTSVTWTDTLSQTISTTVGHSYQLSFYLFNNGGPYDGFSATLGGVTQLLLTNPGAFNWRQYTYDVVATSTSTLLRFAGYNKPGAFWLSGVSFVDTTPVPEPGLALALFSALAFAVWRQRVALQSAR
jgi:hypothetical protein